MVTKLVMIYKASIYLLGWGYLYFEAAHFIKFVL